jgi:hypothetical protein
VGYYWQAKLGHDVESREPLISCSRPHTLHLYYSSLSYSYRYLIEILSISTAWNMSAKHPQRPPFRAEHLGSLLRPKALLDEKHLVDQKKGDQEKLVAIEDESINAIVKEQLDLGFHAVSDGEYRRHMFW